MAGGPYNEFEFFLQLIDELLQERSEADVQVQAVKRQLSINLWHLIFEDVGVQQQTVKSQYQSFLTYIFGALLKVLLLLLKVGYNT